MLIMLLSLSSQTWRNIAALVSLISLSAESQYQSNAALSLGINACAILLLLAVIA